MLGRGPALHRAAAAAATALAAGCSLFGAPAPQPEPQAGPPAAAPSKEEPWAEPATLPETALGALVLAAPRGDEPRTPAEIKAALRSERLGQLILGLAAALRNKPPEVLDELGRLARRQGDFAAVAVAVIAAYPGERGERELSRALSSSDGRARAAAAAAQGARGFPPGGDVEEELAGLLRKDRDWRARAAAGRALGAGLSGQYAPATLKALRAGADDAEELAPVRLECSAALSRAPGAEGEKGWAQLGQGAVSPETDVALYALSRAAELGGRRGAALLGTALVSDRPELYVAAIDLFALVEREAALQALSGRLAGGGEMGRRAALALAAHEGERLAPEIARAMEEGSPILRRRACAALVLAAGAEAAPALARKLLDGREGAAVRAEAARALGACATERSLGALRKAAEGESDVLVRAAARSALALATARIERERAGGARAGPAEIERRALARWRLAGLAEGEGGGGGCRLIGPDGTERVVRIGDEVDVGYRLTRILAVGEEPAAAEALLAGPEAADRECIRAILSKGGRAAVLATPGVRKDR